MSKIGRNDPCPCGSARKYKQCCLAPAQVAVAPPATRPARVDLRQLTGRAAPAPLQDKRGRQLQLITDCYQGDPDHLPEGPWREEGELLAEVQWIDGEAQLTTASIRTADRLRTRLEKLGMVHRDRRTSTPELDESAPALGMLSFKQEFFTRWLDEPLEPLEGLTPRQAASQRRHALLELIRSLETREERLPRAERYDFSPIRQELGL